MPRFLRVIIPLVASLVVSLGSALPVDAALPLERKRCGARITHSFKLANNLRCDEDGLRIRANGITINLNGKTIRGDGDDGDFGIDNSRGHRRVKILTAPGTSKSLIRNFYNGIQVGPQAARNTIRRVIVFNAAHDGIHIDGGDDHRIIGSDVGSSGDEGIELIGNGGVVRGSEALLNDDVGIKIEGAGNDITQNRSNGNGGAGVTILGDLNTFELNTVKFNSGAGIHVMAGTANAVRLNEVCDNAIDNQIVDDGDSTIIEDNDVTNGACP